MLYTVSLAVHISYCSLPLLWDVIWANFFDLTSPQHAGLLAFWRASVALTRSLWIFDVFVFNNVFLFSLLYTHTHAHARWQTDIIPGVPSVWISALCTGRPLHCSLPTLWQDWNWRYFLRYGLLCVLVYLWERVGFTSLSDQLNYITTWLK